MISMRCLPAVALLRRMIGGTVEQAVKHLKNRLCNCKTRIWLPMLACCSQPHGPRVSEVLLSLSYIHTIPKTTLSYAPQLQEAGGGRQAGEPDLVRGRIHRAGGAGDGHCQGHRHLPLPEQRQARVSQRFASQCQARVGQCTAVSSALGLLAEGITISFNADPSERKNANRAGCVAGPANAHCKGRGTNKPCRNSRPPGSFLCCAPGERKDVTLPDFAKWGIRVQTRLRQPRKFAAI